MYKFDGKFKSVSEIAYILAMGGTFQIGQHGRNGDRLFRKEGQAMFWLRGENGSKRFTKSKKVSKLLAIDPREPQQVVEAVSSVNSEGVKVYSYDELERTSQILTSEMNIRDQI